MRRRRILFAGLNCGVRGGHETAELRDIQRTGGGSELRWGSGKRVYGVFPGRSQSFCYQRRPVDNYNPRREGMAQDGGINGGIFHGEMDHHWRKS